MPLNWRIDKENVAHLHITTQWLKKNDILNFACKWMELENTIMSEVTQTQTQKDEYDMYSLISGY